jgi:hypothetical protein
MGPQVKLWRAAILCDDVPRGLELSMSVQPNPPELDRQARYERLKASPSRLNARDTTKVNWQSSRVHSPNSPSRLVKLSRAAILRNDVPRGLGLSMSVQPNRQNLIDRLGMNDSRQALAD